VSGRRKRRARIPALAFGFGLTAILAGAGPAWGQTTPKSAPIPDASVQTYPAEFFDQFHPTTAMTMVTNVPGFTFDNGGSARGYAGNAGNVLIDGRRPPENLQGVLNRMPASVVDHIDLIQGGAPGIDMHDKPVILNIIRKRTTVTTGAANGNLNANTQGDLAPRTGLQVRRQEGERTMDASITLSETPGTIDGTDVRSDPSGGVEKGGVNIGSSTDHRYDATGAVETPFAFGQLRANLHYTTESYRTGNVFLLSVPGGEELSTSSQTFTQGELGLRYTQVLHSGAQWETVFLQQYDINPLSSTYDPEAFTSSTVTKDHQGQSVVSTTLTLPAHGRWTFEGGAEVAYNQEETDNSYTENGLPFILAGEDTQVSEIRSEFFFTGTWRPRPGLTVETGVRYEQSDITASASGTPGSTDQNLNYIKPRINLSWTPVKDNEFSLRIERTVDQLSFSSFASRASFSTGIFGVGTPDLQPESRWTIDAHYQKRFAERGSFYIDLSRQEDYNLLGTVSVFQPDPTTGVPTLYDVSKNVGPASDYSLTVASALPLERLGLRGWTLNLRGSWTYSQIADPVTAIERRLSGEAPAFWSVSLGRSLPSSKWGWNLGLQGPSYSDTYAPRSISSFHQDTRFNVSLSYQATKSLQLTSGLNNLGSGGTRTGYVQFTAPRDTGVELYQEPTRTYGYPSVYVGFRQGF
jgi:hypothetical protein